MPEGHSFLFYFTIIITIILFFFLRKALEKREGSGCCHFSSCLSQIPSNEFFHSLCLPWLTPHTQALALSDPFILDLLYFLAASCSSVVRVDTKLGHI